MEQLTTFDDALGMVLDAAPRPRREIVDLKDSCGRVLARDIRADRDLPPFDRAALDGYAFRVGGKSEGEPVWPVVGEVAAGSRPPRELKEGTSIRIWTGAPVPRGAQGIVPVEEATEVAGGVLLSLPGSAGGRKRAAIALRGEDARRGDRLFARGTRLRHAALPVLAAVGVHRVPVHARPTLAVVSTGDELVPAAGRPSPVQIRSSNDLLIRSLVAAAGVSSVNDLGIARDEPALLKKALARGLEAEILVVSGGVSAGRLDHVPAVLRDLGVRVVFHKVAIRPGKPLLFGVRSLAGRRTAVFGLPGNPVGVLVTAVEFLLPFIRRFQGEVPSVDLPLPVRIETAMRRGGDLLHFVPCALDVDTEGSMRAREIPLRGSGDFAAASRTDALLRVPGDGVGRESGSVLTADLLPGGAPRGEGR